MLPVTAPQSQPLLMPYTGDCRLTPLPEDIILVILNSESIALSDLKEFLCCRKFVKLLNDKRFMVLVNRKMGIGKCTSFQLNGSLLNVFDFHEFLLVKERISYKRGYFQDCLLIKAPLRIPNRKNLFSAIRKTIYMEFANVISCFPTKDFLTVFCPQEFNLYDKSFKFVSSIKLSEEFGQSWYLYQITHDNISGLSGCLIRNISDNSKDPSRLLLIDSNLKVLTLWTIPDRINVINCISLKVILTFQTHLPCVLSVSESLGIRETTHLLESRRIFSSIPFRREVKHLKRDFFRNSTFTNSHYIALPSKTDTSGYTDIELLRPDNLETVRTLHLTPTPGKEIKPRRVLMNETHLYAIFEINVLPQEILCDRRIVIRLNEDTTHWTSIKIHTQEGENLDQKLNYPEILTDNYLILSGPHHVVIFSLNEMKQISTLLFEKVILDVYFKENEYLIVRTGKNELKCWTFKKNLPVTVPTQSLWNSLTSFFGVGINSKVSTIM